MVTKQPGISILQNHNNGNEPYSSEHAQQFIIMSVCANNIIENVTFSNCTSYVINSSCNSALLQVILELHPSHCLYWACLAGSLFLVCRWVLHHTTFFSGDSTKIAPPFDEYLPRISTGLWFSPCDPHCHKGSKSFVQVWSRSRVRIHSFFFLSCKFCGSMHH